MTTRTVSSKLSRIAQALLRRSLPIIGIATLCLGLFAISEWTIDPRLRAKNAKLEAELTRIQSRVAVLKQTRGAIRSEVDRLESDPNEIIYHARDGLGMVKPGEVIYRFDERYTPVRGKAK